MSNSTRSGVWRCKLVIVRGQGVWRCKWVIVRGQGVWRCKLVIVRGQGVWRCKLVIVRGQGVWRCKLVIVRGQGVWRCKWVIVRGQGVWRCKWVLVIHCTSTTHVTLNDTQSIKQEDYINHVQDFHQQRIQYNKNTNFNKKKYFLGRWRFFSTITYVTAIMKWSYVN